MQLSWFLLEDLPGIVVDFFYAAEHVDYELVEVLVLFDEYD